MRLSPHEIDKILLSQTGQLAMRRLARGNRLNIPEAIALITMQIMESARDGKYSVADLMQRGRKILGIRQVIPGVEFVVDEVQIEATFPDGTKLVTVHHPICQANADFEYTFYGYPDFKVANLPSLFLENHPDEGLYPGEVITCSHSPGILINKGRQCVLLSVMNTSDRPIQVGSHYNFIEANPYLVFDRMLSFGKRLNIAAGTSVRFEPGDIKKVILVDIGGKKIVRGGNNLVDGNTSEANAAKVLANVISNKFGNKIEGTFQGPNKRAKIIADEDMFKKENVLVSEVLISRSDYAQMYGPTVGDIVRLADSDIYIRVEADFASPVYGDECKFGGGKTLREGMGQATGYATSDQLDTIITNALIVDYSGIYKADIGIKDGNIVGIGKAGNPDTMDGVSANMVVGVNTEAIAGEGLIVTAGAMDSHIHYICPQICTEAISSGVTTLLGGGTGPASGTCATTCTPGPFHMKMMLQATDELPLNFGFTGKGNTSSPEGLHEIIRAGAVGLKLHEDWGTTPAAIDNCLNIADIEDIQVTIHTDTLNESCCVEGTLKAINGRTIHTYHSEGAGGGHAPDIITVCSHSNVIPSSTNPTRPLTVNTIDEHLDMLMVCHHLSPSIPEDVAFAESRIRHETIAAEDILHDVGAISIISSDSQAMGRVGEVITRTWQTADKMKKQRGQLSEDADADALAYTAPLSSSYHPSCNSQGQLIKTDNFRVRRYVAKYTINPCIAHGVGHLIGSVEVGKLADLVLWKPQYFGVKPEIIIKGGHIAYAQMGDANASIPTPEPVYMRPMFASLGSAASSSSVAFVSRACLLSGNVAAYGLKKRAVAVEKCRTVGKLDMRLNCALPTITVDPETYQVTIDGNIETCKPVSKLPMAQRYFIF